MSNITPPPSRAADLRRNPCPEPPYFLLLVAQHCTLWAKQMPSLGRCRVLLQVAWM